MNFLGIQPVFIDDAIAMALFAIAAWFLGAPWHLAPFLGVAAWRAIAR